jgi:hypothetical protein
MYAGKNRLGEVNLTGGEFILFLACLIFIRICPENKGFLHHFEDGATFSQEEAELILEGSSLDQLPTALAKKIKQFDLVDFLDIYQRNLSVLLRGM